MRISSLFLIGFLLSFAGCTSDSSKIKREGEPAIYTTDADDEEMNKAMRQGKATLPAFLLTISKSDSTIINSAIKVHYDDGVQREYLWVGSLSIENGQLYGVVDNKPEFTSQVVAGQRILVDTTTAVDWNYTQNNRLFGGYTIKLLRNRMTPEERAEFDQSTVLTFDTP
ncbi:DUF2314 domain-containing protein [Hymenobacter sp. J193]|uniref:YegJ family protein n=1 Tax=Hymenobacter sp. J193 TaxID=2898429 RepID=UPI002150EE5B|nr:DUF2314 domain-containing protein [Hymenobacter sp. J193]MCR5887370.1 DUF2314 domain-containing protein [Hymenobacter sp. J193]